MNEQQEHKIEYIKKLLKESGNMCIVQIYKRDIYVFSIEIIYYDGETTVSQSWSIKEFDELNPHIIVNDILDEFKKEKKFKENKNIKYDYETTTKNGDRYGYIINNNHVEIYINDKRWGSPQGERFIIALINDFKKQNEYHEELLNNWNDKVIDKADYMLKLSEDSELGSASYYKYKSYADGLYMSTSMLNLEERKMKRRK